MIDIAVPQAITVFEAFKNQFLHFVIIGNIN